MINNKEKRKIDYFKSVPNLKLNDFKINIFIGKELFGDQIFISNLDIEESNVTIVKNNIIKKRTEEYESYEEVIINDQSINLDNLEIDSENLFASQNDKFRLINKVEEILNLIKQNKIKSQDIELVEKNIQNILYLTNLNNNSKFEFQNEEEDDMLTNFMNSSSKKRKTNLFSKNSNSIKRKINF